MEFPVRMKSPKVKRHRNLKKLAGCPVISSLDPAAISYLRTRPSLFKKILYYCNACRRHFAPRPKPYQPATDLVQWTISGQDAVSTPPSVSLASTIPGSGPGDAGTDVFDCPVIVLPCSEIMCMQCIWDRHFDPSKSGLRQVMQGIKPHGLAGEQETYDAAWEMRWLVANGSILMREKGGKQVLPSRIASYRPMTCPATRKCVYDFEMFQCLPDCPGAMVGIKAPATLKELRDMPVTVRDGAFVLSNEDTRRPANLPEPGQRGCHWIADMCHRCRLVREVSDQLLHLNRQYSVTDQFTACIVMDPTVHVDYQDPSSELISMEMTEDYLERVRMTPWSMPLGGEVDQDLRIVLRNTMKPCVCTKSPLSQQLNETSCSVFWRWVGGEAIHELYQRRRRANIINDYSDDIEDAFHALVQARGRRIQEALVRGPTDPLWEDEGGSDAGSDELGTIKTGVIEVLDYIEDSESFADWAMEIMQV